MLSLGKIDHIHIKVSDLPKALDWYNRVLGLVQDPKYKHMQDGPEGGVMVVNASGTVRLSVSQSPLAVCEMGAVAFVVGGQDFLEWIDQLAGERVVDRNGQTIARDSVRDHQLFCSLSFVDPFGNPFEIVSYDHTWLAGKLKLKVKPTA